jgi:hypothetical protein
MYQESDTSVVKEQEVFPHTQSACLRARAGHESTYHQGWWSVPSRKLSGYLCDLEGHPGWYGVLLVRYLAGRAGIHPSIGRAERESEIRDFPGTLVPLGMCCTHKVLWEHRRFCQYSSPSGREAPLAYPSRGCLGFWVWRGVCHSGVLHFRGQYAPLGFIFGYTISVTDALHLDYDRECAFWSQTVILGKSAFRHRQKA